MFEILFASPIRKTICEKYDTCVYDIFEQCSHDCPNCPRCDRDEPDPDDMRDIERER